jgi:hypothetical protein
MSTFLTLTCQLVPRQKHRFLFLLHVPSVLHLCLTSMLSKTFCFGHLVFQNRSSNCGLFVTQKSSVSLLTPQVMSDLNGCSLMIFMGVYKEGFICFVIITNFLQYHFDMVSFLSNKYHRLLSTNDSKNIDTLLKECDGVKARTHPKKGSHNHDIKLFPRNQDSCYG